MHECIPRTKSRTRCEMIYRPVMSCLPIWLFKVRTQAGAVNPLELNNSAITLCMYASTCSERVHFTFKQRSRVNPKRLCKRTRKSSLSLVNLLVTNRHYPTSTPRARWILDKKISKRSSQVMLLEEKDQRDVLSLETFNDMQHAKLVLVILTKFIN